MSAPEQRRVAAFFGVFILLFLVQVALWNAARGTAIERVVIDVATVRPGAALINALWSGEQVRAVGHRLVSPHARLSVLNGCEGTECVFLLFAAVLAARARARATLPGLLGGLTLVWGLNQARIAALYYSFRFERSWFELVHGYVAPLAVVVVSGLFFLWWFERAHAVRR